MSEYKHNKQLFTKFIDGDLLKLIKITYNIKNINNHTFTRKDLNDNNIITKLEEIKLVLYYYYLKCKGIKYLENITINRSLTILRQILKEFNYKITSKHKYNNGEKYILYQIHKIKKISKDDLHMNFD